MHRCSCALITGANTGIGKETARKLIEKGVHVVVACRNSAKTEAAVHELRLTECEDGKAAAVEHLELNLASLSSVERCAKHVLNKRLPINLLINNAGVMACPLSFTEDGFEMQFGVNHVGHFLLTKLLVPALLQSAPSRVITLSSHAHFAGNINYESLLEPQISSYDPFKAYAQSKLANVLFSKELARRMRGSSVMTYAVHPGLVATELGRHVHHPHRQLEQNKSFSRRVISRLSKTPFQGAQTSIYCALEPSLYLHSGSYYSNCHRMITSPVAWAETSGRKLWTETERLISQQRAL